MGFRFPYALCRKSVRVKKLQCKCVHTFRPDLSESTSFGNDWERSSSSLSALSRQGRLELEGCALVSDSPSDASVDGAFSFAVLLCLRLVVDPFAATDYFSLGA
jgi:hypothetical protein